MASPAPDDIVHATCVALGRTGILLTGPSGSGKSGLALELMALGAALVSDDRTQLTATPDGIIATAPAPLRGLIEARGVGLLAAEPQAQAIVRLVIDLGTEETDRLPHHRTTVLLGQEIPLLHRVAAPHFAAAIVQLLRGGRVE